MEALKAGPDRRMVVQADDRPALELAQCRGHGFVLGPPERHAVALRLPVRRIEIEQRVRPVVPTHALLPVEPLDLRGSQPQMSRTQLLLDAQQVDRQRRRRRAPGLAGYVSFYRASLTQNGTKAEECQNQT